MSVNAFLAWENRRKTWREHDGPAAVAAHAGRGWSMQAAVAGGLRDPDAFVTRLPAPRGAQVITEPVVAFAIARTGTATDRDGHPRQDAEKSRISRHIFHDPWGRAKGLARGAGAPHTRVVQ